MVTMEPSLGTKAMFLVPTLYHLSLPVECIYTCGIKRGFRMESYSFRNVNLIICSRMEKKRDYWHHKHILKSYHQTYTCLTPLCHMLVSLEHTNSFENRWKLWTLFRQKFCYSFKDFTVNLKAVQISQVVNLL